MKSEKEIKQKIKSFEKLIKQTDNDLIIGLIDSDRHNELRTLYFYQKRILEWCLND